MFTEKKIWEVLVLINKHGFKLVLINKHGFKFETKFLLHHIRNIEYRKCRGHIKICADQDTLSHMWLFIV